MKTIIGPPGTGKTQYIENLIKNGNNDDFLYMTYNASMGDFARKRIDENPDRIGTFHSILSRMLGISPFLSPNDLTEFAKRYGISYGPEKELDRFLRWYDYIENTMKKPFTPSGEKLAMLFLYDKYKEYKEEMGKYDYTDILKIASQNIMESGTLYIDEAQDLTPLMWKIVDNFNAEKIIVGDPHQSINSYRGVDINAFMRHAENIEYLRESYRFGDNLRVIADKSLSSGRVLNVDYHGLGNTQIGNVKSIREFAMMEGEKAILCRTNNLAYKLANTLEYAMLPISQRHGWNNGWGKDTFKIAGIMSKFPKISPDEFAYIIKKSPATLWQRGVKSVVMKEPTIFSYNMMKEKIDRRGIVMKLNVKEETIRNTLKLIDNPGLPRIFIDTIHSAKGLEFDHVLLVSDLPSGLKFEAEEKRILYTGITRARKSFNFAAARFYHENFTIPGIEAFAL